MRAHRLYPALLGAGALVVLPLACMLRNPLLTQWRAVGTPLLSVFVIAVLCMMCRYSWRNTPRLGLYSVLFGLWISALGFMGSQELAFHWRKHRLLHNTSAEARALGAHIIIGYSHPDEVRSLASKGLVGGIFIGTNTMRGKTIQAIASEIEALQRVRLEAGLPPLIVSTDQEGGIVARMSPPLEPTPPLADIIAGARSQEIEALAFSYGQAHGRGLADLGVTVNFAPLADLSYRRARNKLDFHSLIARRAIAADPHRVSAAVIGYARGLEDQGIQATLKHFPGLGRVTADTHLFKAALTSSESTLEGSDWIPFREGLQSTRSLLMVGHASLAAVDANNPASLSRKVIQGIVRNRWGHEGVLVTDDMAMVPVVRHGMCKAGVDAINAGIDLLLMSYDTDQYYTVMHCLLQARRDGRLEEAALHLSDQRLKTLQRPGAA